ncbi:MAG: sialidase family protein, partial [Chitinophagaceae bacterium]|nr:sialidase family protein [Chitinophagaceae bacterium]
MINRKHYPVLLILLCIAGISTLHLSRKPSFSKKSFLIDTGQPEQEEGGKRRAEYEWKLLRNPKTGIIPEGIRQQELEWVKTVPFKNENLQGPSVANTYIPVGPSQNGGRTRSLAFDVRYNGTSNRVMLAGGVNGGIFRSTDGGQTWVFVHPVNEIRAVSCFAQDPRPGFQDTWYAGTGEAVGSSAAYPNAFVYGNGIFKSTDNGLTWTILTSTTNGDPFGFDNPFDFVYNLAVNPVNGHVYAAAHRRIIRSTNAGSSWSTVLGSTTASTALAGISDIIINKAGSKLYAFISGRNPDRGLAGVWMSSTGDTATWTRIAGGVQGQADSIPAWRAYNNTTVSGDFTAGWGRGILALAPSNQNILYVMYDNTQSESTTEAEADLFRCDMTNPAFVWSNLSANLIAKRNGSTNTFFKIQGGYDMSIAVHPNIPNTIVIGGVSLFRSTDGFNTQNNVLFAGGQTSTTFTDPGRNSHVDYHLLAFDPSNANRLITASDGGLEVCNNITASSPVWNLLDGQYQTIQYYHVGIDPTTGSRNYFGGAQDNSTTLRDLTGFLGSILPDSNDHFILIGGDGGQVGMTKKNGSNQQFLFGTAQLGQLYRVQLFSSNNITSIKPSNSGEGEFITYFHLDEDNTNFL